MQVSFYKPLPNKNTVENTFNSETVHLVSILNDIKKGLYKTQIQELRNLVYKSKEYDFKKMFLPAFTPSGVFKKRKDSEIIKHSGILSFDTDNLSSIEHATDIRDAVSIDKYVFGAFISPSGKGVKWFVKIEPDQHEKAWLFLRYKYEVELGVIIDKCKDKSRLCFISHDDETFINENCSVFHLSSDDEKAVSRKISIEEIRLIANRIKGAAKDITNGYEDWLKLGFSLADGLGEKGRSIFHDLSCFHSDYDRDKADKQFDHCLNNKKESKGITIRSFFYLAKKYGIDIRTDYENLKTNSIKNSYGEEITDRERIENAINEIYEIRRNIILDRIECKERNVEGSIWEAANEDDISRELELKRVKGCGPNRVRSIINSKFVKKFNPFFNYFESLSPYTRKEPDYIQHLSEIVQLKNEQQDRERFNRHLKKALVRCVACSLADGINNLNYNKHAIVFISPKQSIGKSGFIRFLIPKELEMYCVEKMTFGNRDEQFTMQSSFIINLDEMASIEERNIQSVKSAMSTGIINVRKINSGQRIIEPRRCNFFGNTNETHILKDDTGTVRWLCFEVEGFNIERQYWKPESDLYVDINRVWAMAYHLFKSGFEFQLTSKEISENERVNEHYKELSIEEQLINLYLKPAPQNKKYFKQPIEIIKMLRDKEPTLALNINKIGSALKKNNFLYGQEYDSFRRMTYKGYYAEVQT